MVERGAHQTDVAVAAARATVGDARVDPDAAPVTGGEDFSYMLQRKPGAFIFLGTGTEHALHTPLYDFNDAVIPYGVGFFLNLVRPELG